MILQDFRCLVLQALKTAQDAGLLPPIPVDFTVEHPPRFKKESIALGGYATNVALNLRKSLKGNPLQYAQTLFEKMEILPPGFINFMLCVSFLQDEVERILQEDKTYGKVNLGKGQRLCLEFVSANPTGSVHVGNGRCAFIGDVLANVLLSAGYAVEKEFYINDFGGQMLKLGRALSAYYLQLLGEAVEIERREELDQQDCTNAEAGKHLKVSFWSRFKQSSGSWSDWEALPYGGLLCLCSSVYTRLSTNFCLLSWKVQKTIDVLNGSRGADHLKWDQSAPDLAARGHKTSLKP